MSAKHEADKRYYIKKKSVGFKKGWYDASKMIRIEEEAAAARREIEEAKAKMTQLQSVLKAYEDRLFRGWYGSAIKTKEGEKLHNTGLQICRGALDAKIVEELQQRVRKGKNWKWLDIGDEKGTRQMHFLGRKMKQLVHGKIADRILDIIGVKKGTEAFEQVILYGPSILRSAGGGLSRPQRFHRDNHQDEIRRVATEFCPFNAIVAFEACTLDFLHDENDRIVTGVVDGEGCDHEAARKLVQKHERKSIKLQPGDLVLFRGDAIHAGSKYAEENKRLHLYFISAVENDLREANKVTKADLKTEWLEESDYSTALEVVSSLHMQ